MFSGNSWINFKFSLANFFVKINMIRLASITGKFSAREGFQLYVRALIITLSQLIRFWQGWMQEITEERRHVMFVG